MQYPSKQTYIDAVRWDAPTDDTSDGNLAEMQAFVGEVPEYRAELRKQDPWNPAEGQNCLVLERGGVGIAFDRQSGEATEYADGWSGAISPGEYLVRLPDGGLGVVPAASFEAAYDVPDAGPRADPNAELQAATDSLTSAIGTEVPLGEAGTVNNEPSATE